MAPLHCLRHLWSRGPVLRLPLVAVLEGGASALFSTFHSPAKRSEADCCPGPSLTVSFHASLGRRSELQQLLDRAQNDQIPITVVRGESGAGKTSLLQAGLQYTLKKENCVYWEARSQNAPAGLLHAIQSVFPEVQSLDTLPSACKNRWVLILDQFEQISAQNPDHHPVFMLLERIVRENPPHKLSVVIRFRRRLWRTGRISNSRNNFAPSRSQ